MLFLSRRYDGPGAFIDINKEAIDEFYYAHLDFDPHGAEAERFIGILDEVEGLLGGHKRPRLKGHDAIHLILFVDALLDGYAPVWKERLPAALDQFLHGLAKGKTSKDDLAPDEFWTQYGQWTRVNSDRGERIAHRHAFYVEKMLGFIGDMPQKDSKRLFGDLERELIYYRDKKRCGVCGGQVAWGEAEFHHVVEHSKGGQTTIENGRLVHAECHPKGHKAVTFASANSTGSGEQVKDASPA
jgi:5-methylcytosine-specific restriction endonuclease McrA